LSGVPLTSTWNFGGSFTPTNSIPFTGEVILLANAKKNCAFMGWSDGNIEPMRIVDITANVTYTAQFANVEGMEELLAQIAELLEQINVLKDSINNLKLQNENLQAQIDSLQKLLDDCINSQKVPSFDFPSLKIYPNPAKDNVTVVLSENTVGTLALFDLSGKIVRRQSVNDNIATVDIASLSVGTYILRLVKDGVAGAGVKIVKE